MRGTGEIGSQVNFSVRWLPDIPVKRAELRFTATTAVASNLSLGVEFNPLDDDVGLLANWRILDETDSLPALIVGTSSDRIGTPNGRAYYATFSKDLRKVVDLPIAPYLGTAYGDFDDEWEIIGGTVIRWKRGWISTHSWDGHNLHHQMDYTTPQGPRIGLVVAEQSGKHYTGISVGFSL